MCGIGFAANFAGHKNEPVNLDCINIFEDQRKRGTEGFGVVTVGKDGKPKVSRATEMVKFMWDMHMDASSILMFHHRTPTSSENKINQTHPFHIEHKELEHKYLVVHNGIITNCDLLRKEHEALKYKYKTPYFCNTWKKERYNDSEALAVELARFIEGKTKVVGTRGSAAFIVIRINGKTGKADMAYFGKNKGWSPLLMFKTRGIIRVSSEGKGEEVAESFLYSMPLTGEMPLSRRRIPFADDTKEPVKVVEPAKPAIGYKVNPEQTQLLPSAQYGHYETSTTSGKQASNYSAGYTNRSGVWKPGSLEEDIAAGDVCEGENDGISHIDMGDRTALGDGLMEYAVVREDTQDKMYGLLEEFYEELCIPTRAKEVDINEWLNQIKLSLEEAKDQALESHKAALKEGYVIA